MHFGTVTRTGGPKGWTADRTAGPKTLGTVDWTAGPKIQGTVSRTAGPIFLGPLMLWSFPINLERKELFYNQIISISGMKYGPQQEKPYPPHLPVVNSKV